MKNKIQKFSKGDFRTPKPEVVFEETNLVLIIGEGEMYHGLLKIKSNNGIPVRGLIYSSSFRVRFRKPGFDGTDVKLEYCYDGKGLPPGHVEQGKITVVCSGGEYELNITAIIEKPYITTSHGKIQTTDDFRKLAMKDYSEAVRLFRSKSFYEILKYENERTFYLYDNMRKWSLGEEALEEFLVGIKQKECIFLTLSGEGMLFEDVTESTKTVITVMKNTWGYIPIRVEADGDFIRILKPEISTDDFVGNTYELEYIVQPEKLHAGKNFGRIILSTPYEKLSYDVEVLQSHEYNEKHHLPELLKAQILKEYLAYQGGRMELEDWAASANEKLIELRRLDPMNEMYQLYHTHVHVLEKRTEEAKWLLETFNYNRFAVGKDPIVNCYYLYLTALIRGNGSHTDRVLDEIGNTFLRYPDNWQLLQMLLRLDGRYRYPSKRLEVLEQQFAFSCNEVLFYLEAYQCFQDKPRLLKKLGAFEIQVIGFAAKYRLLDEEMAMYVVNFASQQKNFHAGIYRILKHIYNLYPGEAVLNAICTLLIKGNKTEKKYHVWYQKAVEAGLRIARLYEYYIQTLDQASVRGPLPKQIFLYFLHGNSLDYKKLSFLYANLLTYDVGGETLYEEYKEQMEQFTWTQLMMRHITDNLRVLYKRFCRPEEMDEGRMEAMRDICYSYQVSTKIPNMNYVLVIEKDGKIRQRVPYDSREGCVLYLRDKESRIVWEAVGGRHYTDSIPYETRRLFYEPRYLELCKSFEAKEQDPAKKAPKLPITFENIRQKGLDAFPEDEVFRFCSEQIRECNYEEEEFLLHLTWCMFDAGQYDKVTLLYLSKYYCGPTKDMKRLWKVLKSQDISSYKMGERIITQMIFSENVMNDEEIFLDYYVSDTAYFRMKQAYLAYICKEYLIGRKELGESAYEIMLRELKQGEELPDICKIALLDHYSANAYPDEAKDILHGLVKDMCEKQLALPFYQKYDPTWVREVQLYDKTFVYYQADPGNVVKLFYKFRKKGRDELGFRSERLLPIFENLYVKQFILYEDELLTYYVQESDGQEVWETQIRTIRHRQETEAGKYGRINAIIRAEGEEKTRAMKQFSEEERIAEQLFHIY